MLICGLLVLDSAAMKIILQQFAELKEDMRTLKSSVSELQKRQRGVESTKSGMLPNGVILPLKTVADVNDLELKLKSRDTYSQVVSVVLYMALFSCVFILHFHNLNSFSTDCFSWCNFFALFNVLCF